MGKRLLKIFGISLFSVLLLITLALLIIREYSPAYFIPYLIHRVENETNGRYTLSINSDSVQVRFLTMSLNLGSSKFVRDSSVQTNSGIEFLDKFDVSASFNSLKISSVHLISLAFSGRIIVDEISLDHPSVTVRKNIYYSGEDKVDRPREHMQDIMLSSQGDSLLADTLAMHEFRQSRNSFLPYIRVKDFHIEDFSFALYDGRKQYPLRQVQGFDFNVVNFISDEKDEISVDDASIYIDSASTLVSRNIARLTGRGISIHTDSVHLDQLHFGHVVDPYRMNRIRGFRSSWLDVWVNDIDVEGLHPGELINDSAVFVDKVGIGVVDLNLFKDKAELKINPAHKPLPPEIIRGIPLALKIDTIEIEDANLLISMEAPKADVPGQITLDHMSARITNFVNIPEYLEQDPMMRLSSNFKVMNEAELKVDFVFDISSGEDAFSFHCVSNPFDATVLNGFVGSQFFIQFSSGRVDRMDFTFNGNNMANVGTMDFEYSNLKIKKLEGYDKYLDGKPNTGLVASVGNFLISRNRSAERGSYKTAAIYYEKEYNRDVIHGTIMSMLSGVTSSFGFSSKNVMKMQEKAINLDESATNKSAEQALKQAEKAEKKEEKKRRKEQQ